MRGSIIFWFNFITFGVLSMRTYAYVRIENCVQIESRKLLSFFKGYGYEIQKNRLVLEEVSVNKSVVFRDKFLNLINYSLEEGDLLIVKSIDCLGCNFEEILFLTEKIYQNKIRFICLDYSKMEIDGDMRLLFIHFLKICFDFERKLGEYNIKQTKKISKVGRPEILTSEQKLQVVELYKKGASVYYLAKYFSVTRTVIQRVLDKAAKNNI